jgi:tetratricopeptide (TPR) repeat protein
MAHHDLGYAEMTLGHHDTALGEFRKEIQTNPSFDGAYLRAGVIELERNRLPEADEMLRQAVARNPTNASAHFELARACLKEQRLDEAEAQYRQALELDPKLIRAHYGLAQALKASGKQAEAEREFKLFRDLLAQHRSSQGIISASGNAP